MVALVELGEGKRHSFAMDVTAEQVSPVGTHNGSHTSYQLSQLLMLAFAL